MAEAELGGAEGGVGKSGGFTSSHRTACGVGRREGLLGMGTSLPPCAGLPVSSGHINRGLQFSVFCFPTCNACGSVLSLGPFPFSCPASFPPTFPLLSPQGPQPLTPTDTLTQNSLTESNSRLSLPLYKRNEKR